MTAAETQKLMAIADAVDGYRTPDHYYFLISSYLSTGDMAAAQNMLDKVNMHFDLDDRRWAEYQDYQAAYDIWMQLESQNRSELTNNERVDLEIIAYRKSTLANGLARSILSFYDDQQFSETLVEPVFNGMGKSNSNKTKKISSASNISLYPNPSQGLVFIHGLGEADVVADVYNANGQKLKETSLDLNTSVIDLTGFSSGVYNIRLRSKSDNRIIHQEKIVIAK